MTGMGLVQRSFYGGILILVILAVRAVLLDRLPKRTFPVLWVVVLLRLLLPISFSSVFSIYSLMQPEQTPEMLETVTYGVTDGTAVPEIPFIGVTAPQNPVLGEGLSAMPKGNPLSILFVIWCMGAVLCAAFFGFAYLRCLWGFRTAVPVEDSQISQRLGRRKSGHFIVVRQSDRISAPLTYGILRPVILLPERLVWESSQELEYVLQHEYVHICHFDTALKLAMVAALCIHWFNPLVWLMSWLLNRDIELACDEGVLRRFGEQSRAGYAMTLIGMEEKKRGLLPLYNGFSKNAIEERIRLIMKYKKTTYMTAVSALLLVLAIMIVFATSAKQAKAEDNTENLSGNIPETDLTGELMDPPKGSNVSDVSAPEEENQINVSEPFSEEGQTVQYIKVSWQGEVFDSDWAPAGFCDTLDTLVWMAYRGGDIIAEDLTADEDVYIAESIQVMEGSDEVNYDVWVRLIQEAVNPESGTIGQNAHKDYIFYRQGEDAYIGIQSTENNELWTIIKMADYGAWLEKEIGMYIRMTTGL